ncbi:MAG: lipid A export permease/ATP-binding protein MsbA [Polaromonas sp.]|nr:lipid A export permease/ATP-binding protein MsbA [Polaromonas sp.]
MEAKLATRKKPLNHSTSSPQATPPTAKKRTIPESVRRLWPYFSSSKSGWILAIVATLMASATEPMVPALLKPLLDRGFQPGGELSIWQVPVFLMLLFGVRGLAGFFAQYGLAKVTNVGLQKLREAMFDKLLSARFSLFTEQTSSTIANTVVYEVQNGSSLLVNAVMRLSRDLLSMLALIGYLLYLNWKLTLVVALIFPAVIAVVRILSKRLYRLTKESQKATDDLAYVVEENVMAHRDIRLHAAQKIQSLRFHLLSLALRHLSIKSTVAHAGMSALTQLLAAVALSAVVSIALLQSADGATTVGSFVAFVTAMLLLIAPIKSLSDAATPITRGIAALERGLNLLDHIDDETSGTFSKSRVTGDITFTDVSVRYKTDANPALDQLNLTIKPGETIAIVGTSGSGKSTLVNLLPRFQDLSSGAISLDGVALKEWSLTSLREQFAFVSQHVVMLNESIASNVALGQSIDRARVTQCLQAANLEKLLAELPKGIDTLLGHNAMQLSGGQRQRLAIARALYKDAPILILDEATSALDTESEQAVQQAIQRLTADRTSVIIAHRLSTIQHADRIIMLESGRVLESGSHAELLANGGAYSHLYQLGFNTSSKPH